MFLFFPNNFKHIFNNYVTYFLDNYYDLYKYIPLPLSGIRMLEFYKIYNKFRMFLLGFTLPFSKIGKKEQTRGENIQTLNRKW